MHALAALALSTPIWGFALQPPTVIPAIAPVTQVDTAVVRGAPGVGGVELRAEAYDTSMMEWTRNVSLATVVGFAAAGVLGAIQFADEYGFHDDISQTACATGDNVLDDCGAATPWPHLLAVGTTAGLGLTTLVLSTQVDYDQAARRDGDWRIYEVTRWIGLAMFAVQAAGGFLLANALRWGWADEQQDFDTLQVLAGAHLAWGAATAGLEIYNTAILF